MQLKFPDFIPMLFVICDISYRSHAAEIPSFEWMKNH